MEYHADVHITYPYHRLEGISLAHAVGLRSCLAVVYCETSSWRGLGLGGDVLLVVVVLLTRVREEYGVEPRPLKTSRNLTQSQNHHNSSRASK